MPTRPTERCNHSHVYLDVSPHAPRVGFKRETQRAATLAKTKLTSRAWDAVTSQELFEDATTFPGPLVLPEDDLADDPKQPPQTVRAWRDYRGRNPVTPERKTIYLVPSPVIKPEMSKMKTWEIEAPAESSKGKPKNIEPPSMDDLVAYLSAFYHGMDVKVLSQPFFWQIWGDNVPVHRHRGSKSKAYDATPIENPDGKVRRIGLLTPRMELFGIRCRPSPDVECGMQVHLSDVLDALGASIPTDAHSIMIFLDQDMYEGDGDLFTAGRAYGGSRIAAVSCFRDHPSCAPLDDGHAWPSSHCAAFIDKLCLEYSGKEPPKRARVSPVERVSGALHAAIEVATVVRSTSSAEALSVQWFGRVVQTMAHELGHCLAIGHCSYFACVMQGCGSVMEAQRQPPYLCPICLEKIATTIGEGLIKDWNSGDKAAASMVRAKYVRDRYKALRTVCERWGRPEISRLFAGHKGWLDEVLKHDSSGGIPSTR